MTTLDLSILGLLADQPLHGYELKKRLTALTEGWSPVSFGSLYPALNRLDKAGLITSSAPETRPRVPMTGSLGAEIAALRDRDTAHTPPGRGRRNRKVYRITDTGRSRLVELLAAPDEGDRAFSTQLAFARHLDHHGRLELLRRRRTELQARLDTNVETARGRDRYRSAAYDRGRIRTRSELDWLDALITEELDLESSTEATASGDAAPLSDPLPHSVVGGT